MKINRKTSLILGFLVLFLVANTFLIIIITRNFRTPSLEKVGQFPTGGDAVDVEVHGDLAFVSDMKVNQLLILNVSDPRDPMLLSTFQAHGNHQLTVIANGSDEIICLLTDHDYGLILLNASNPSNPTVLSRYQDPGEIDDLTVVEDLVYVVDQVDGLEIVNISDPRHPIKVGAFQYGVEGYHVDVIVRDHIAFLSDVKEGLYIVNVSDPTHIVEMAHVARSDFYWMDLQGDLLYIPHEQTIEIYNISLPSDPLLVASIDDGGQNGVIWVDNDIAYISDFELGFEIYAIHDLTDWELLVSFNDGGMPFGFWVKSSYIYVADKTDDLEILRFTLPQQSD